MTAIDLLEGSGPGRRHHGRARAENAGSRPEGDCYCERIVRTVRRECLDFIIPLSEQHLKRTLHEWVAHYNHRRPHESLGPGIPLPLEPLPEPSPQRHQISDDCCVKAKPILGGLHHEYSLEKLVA